MAFVNLFKLTLWANTKFFFKESGWNHAINRGKKSLRHVSTVAKFLDDNKPKTWLKKWIRTVSNFIHFISYHLICQILATLFQVLNPKGQDLSLQKGKENFHVVFTCSIKWAREIGKFHVAVGRRRLGNVQKSVMHAQSCCFANLNLLLFCRSRCRRHRRCLSSILSKNCATRVTWRQTSPLLLSSTWAGADYLIWVLIEFLELNFYVYRFP